MCRHKKSDVKEFRAGWKVWPDIAIGKNVFEVIAWCSSCGALKIWKNDNKKSWVKPGELK